MDEAHAQVEFLLNEEPFLNLAYHRLIYDSHHLREEDLQHRLAALRKAGMPEWPLSFQGDPAQRLTGSEMKDLISGKTWAGIDTARNGEFVQEFGIEGNVVYAGPASLLNGKAFVKKDELCEQFEGFVLSRALCGPVYHNPDGTPDKKNEYIYVNPTTVRYFSL